MSEVRYTFPDIYVLDGISFIAVNYSQLDMKVVNSAAQVSMWVVCIYVECVFKDGWLNWKKNRRHLSYSNMTYIMINYHYSLSLYRPCASSIVSSSFFYWLPDKLNHKNCQRQLRNHLLGSLTIWICTGGQAWGHNVTIIIQWTMSVYLVGDGSDYFFKGVYILI